MSQWRCKPRFTSLASHVALENVVHGYKVAKGRTNMSKGSSDRGLRRDRSDRWRCAQRSNVKRWMREQGSVCLERVKRLRTQWHVSGTVQCTPESRVTINFLPFSHSSLLLHLIFPNYPSPSTSARLRSPHKPDHAAIASCSNWQ